MLDQVVKIAMTILNTPKPGIEVEDRWMDEMAFVAIQTESVVY
jgi:hypothetical protein